MKLQLNFNYDQEHDVMYITVPENREAIGNENEEGVIVRYAINNGDVVGVTIMDWKRYRQKSIIELLKNFDWLTN